ncbi:hypothetical protein TL16_g01598 [Triparma laevis f. inornata]|uniref:TOG domain-containing protein n=1 Tax=Triparma laevis f. inornata TaxID=1714386 RepID=A0A9W6ZKV6_9STRA|nr:hypothetical protein TL16_g01598 [Triparma laevis f. inornata]
MNKLAFSVVSSSGEETDYPARELNKHSPQTRGWQSPRFCSYPQTLILQLHDPASSISQLQILAHQSKIPTKIEVVIARGGSAFENCTDVKRLGYISLDSNERSNFQARELKSVHVNADQTSFVKLVVHRCHVNKYNAYNQVGLIAINCLGVSDSVVGNVSVEGYRSSGHQVPGNSSSGKTGGRAGGAGGARSLQFKDPQLTQRLKALEGVKKAKAAAEDFDDAALLKAALDNVTSLAEAVDNLAARMKEAAVNEDYAEAARLKKQREATKLAMNDALEDAESSCRAELENFSGGGRGEAMTREATEAGSRRMTAATEAAPANVHRTPSGALTRDVFRSPGVGGVRQDDDDDGDWEGTNDNDDYAASSPSGRMGGGKKVGMDDNPFGAPRSSPGNVFEKALPGNKGGYKFSGGGDGMDEEIPQAEKEEFAEGEHPLDGVPLLNENGTVHDLPTPEHLSKGSDRQEVEKLVKILGEYRVRCFFSSNWQLRDAVLTKTSMMIEGLIEDPGFETAAPALCSMIERAVDDRNPKVFLTSLIVLDDVLHEMEKAAVPSATCIPMLSNIVSTLIIKLSDRAQPKAVEGAFSMLVNFALSSCVGHVYMGSVALKSLPSRVAPKTVVARFELLSKLVAEFGDEAVSGSRVLEFVKDADGFSNKDGKVRVAAKDLVKSIYGQMGKEVLSFLGDLSARMLKEYRKDLSKLQTVGEAIELGEEDDDGDRYKSGLPTFEKAKRPAKKEEEGGGEAPAPKGRGRGRGRGKRGGR